MEECPGCGLSSRYGVELTSMDPCHDIMRCPRCGHRYVYGYRYHRDRYSEEAIYRIRRLEHLIERELFPAIESKVKQLKSPKGMSGIMEKFKVSILTEPDKSFRKLGITNGDGLLTSEGTELFLNFLFQRSKEDFYKEVVKKLAEEEKKK